MPSPISAPIPATTGKAPIIAPVAPTACNPANNDHAATLPIPAWMPAAAEPAATPAPVKPAAETPRAAAPVAAAPVTAPTAE